MDKNMDFGEEPAKALKSDKRVSDGEQFVKRVAASGVVLKFKVGKYGTHPSSSDVLSHGITIREKQNIQGQSEHFETNTQSMSEQSEIRNEKSRNNKIPFLESSIRTIHDEEFSSAETVNMCSSKEADQMILLKGVAMDTYTTGVNGTSSSQNAKNVTCGFCLTRNHDNSASQIEEHRCVQCGKIFMGMGSLYGHMGVHRREEYKLIRTILQRPSTMDISGARNQNCQENRQWPDIPEMSGDGDKNPEKVIQDIWKASHGLIKVPLQDRAHKTKSNDGIHSSEDTIGDNTDTMEVADLLLQLSQTGRNDVVNVPAPAPFASYRALGGHKSTHYKWKTRERVDTTARNSGISGEKQTWKYFCIKCNERFPTGQSLGGHKRKHWFEQQKMIAATGDAPVLLHHRTMLVPGSVLLTDTNMDELDEDAVNPIGPKAYDAVQPLQANNLANETEDIAEGAAAQVDTEVVAELPPAVGILVERSVLNLNKLPPEANTGDRLTIGSYCHELKMISSRMEIELALDGGEEIMEWRSGMEHVPYNSYVQMKTFRPPRI